MKTTEILESVKQETNKVFEGFEEISTFQEYQSQRKLKKISLETLRIKEKQR